MEPVARSTPDPGGSLSPSTWLRTLAVADVVPVLVLIAIGLVPDPDGPNSVVAALLVPLPLLARRRWPVAVFALVVALGAVRIASEQTTITDTGVLLALYTVASARPTAFAVGAAILTEIGMVVAVAQYADDDGSGPLIGVTGLVVAATALGVNVRGRRALVASLEDRAARLEIERDQEGQLAAAAERARISREMHDIVAHNLAVMVALADGAAMVATTTPGKAEQAMQDVASTGRHALTEMRRLLGVLREDGPEARAPQPGLGAIPELVEQVRAAGIDVNLDRLDEPAVEPSPGLQLAVYRIVQESLTNALKHGGGAAAARVSIRWEGQTVTVHVSSKADAPPSEPAGVGGGLTGMRERAAAFDGTVEAGSDATGGWTVRATLSDEPRP